MNTQHKILFTNANYFPRVYLFPYFNLAALPPTQLSSDNICSFHNWQSVFFNPVDQEKQFSVRCALPNSTVRDVSLPAGSETGGLSWLFGRQRYVFSLGANCWRPIGLTRPWPRWAAARNLPPVQMAFRIHVHTHDCFHCCGSKSLMTDCTS